MWRDFNQRNGKGLHLGCFGSPEEAALPVARWLRNHPASDGPPPMIT
jgi:hypothetical protein